jgi:hypothetical protein
MNADLNDSYLIFINMGVKWTCESKYDKEHDYVLIKDYNF